MINLEKVQAEMNEYISSIELDGDNIVATAEYKNNSRIIFTLTKDGQELDRKYILHGIELLDC